MRKIQAHDGYITVFGEKDAVLYQGTFEEVAADLGVEISLPQDVRRLVYDADRNESLEYTADSQRLKEDAWPLAAKIAENQALLIEKQNKRLEPTVVEAPPEQTPVVVEPPAPPREPVVVTSPPWPEDVPPIVNTSPPKEPGPVVESPPKTKEELEAIAFRDGIRARIQELRQKEKRTLEDLQEMVDGFCVLLSDVLNNSV